MQLGDACTWWGRSHRGRSLLVPALQRDLERGDGVGYLAGCCACGVWACTAQTGTWGLSSMGKREG